jgi:Zn-dependent peptidase ImmA (M78 family)/DNA-binding XRE family transcriptional regulator
MAFFPERLSWIRKKRGLTKSALAAKVDLDLRSISAHESGEFGPRDDTLVLLSRVLDVPLDFFSKGPLEGPEATQVSFRSFSKLSASKRDMALGSAAIAFAFCEWISARFELPQQSLPDLRNEGAPESAAMALRYQWGLGEQPVSNMVHLLESRGVRVFSLSLDIADVDACCTWHNGNPFVFLNTKKSNARRRFDAAHELAHLVLHRHGDYENRNVEKEADEFASAFLMPRAGVSSTAPRLPDLKSIVPIKQKWGVSLAAYIYRLHALGLITDWHYRTLFIQASKRGYRSNEPSDHRAEMSKLAELVLGQLRQEGIGLSYISNELGLNERDLADLLFGIAVFGVEGAATKLKGSETSQSLLKLAVDNSKK